MKIITKPYKNSKKGEDLKDCEDDYAINPKRFRYAVADGATQEFFSAKLAQELVKKFCFDESELNKNILTSKRYEEWLESIQEEWKKYLKHIIDTEEVSYMVENRYYDNDSGASTFVGLELDIENQVYKAMIIGDCCLFHIRNNEMLQCYIIDNYRNFDNNPEFFFSIAEEERDFIAPQIITENFEEGDYFLLASDAISKWLLYQNEKKEWKKIWNELLKKDIDWYNHFIEEKRIDRENRLDDDDVTILIVSTSNSSELIPFEDRKKIDNREERELIENNAKDIDKSEESNSVPVENQKKSIKPLSINLDTLSTQKQEYQKVLIFICKEPFHQRLDALRHYIKFESEKKGFKFIIQKQNKKIDEKYQNGIIFLDYKNFDKMEMDSMNECFSYYRFSRYNLDKFYFNEDFNSYIQYIEDIEYDDIYQIPKRLIRILSEY